MADLIYLYGIVPSDAPDAPEELRGLEDGPVALLRVGRVAGVIGAVPEELYTDDALNARLDDLAWVGERGVAHERVLDWYAERSPVIPLSLFSLHRDPARVGRRIEAEEDEYTRLLQRLRGRREWGVKLWRHEAAARAGIDRLSPSLRELGMEIEEAPPGKRFLLEKKREAMRAEESRVISKRVTHDVYGALHALADGAVAVPLPANVPGGDRALLLHAAYLVADTGFEAFQARVNELAGRFAGSGFELEFTGPWPPYHFAAPPDE